MARMSGSIDVEFHILHVVPSLGVGGMELALSRMVRGTSDIGFRHSIVSLKGDAVIRDEFDSSVEIFCMHARPNELALPLRLRRIIKQVRPTVIHARNWGAWPDVALARLLVSPRVPLMFSFHGVSEAGAMPLRRRLAFRALAAITTYVFTVSEAARQFLVGHVGLPARRVGVIPNGVDTDRFRPGASRKRRGAFIIGSVGSLTPVKNHALLIHAAAELIAGGQEVELRLAGEGPERDALETLADSLGVGNRVHLPGHVADIPSFLQQLDAFVLPSRSEAHPNALLEAMACGLPCVATRMGGVLEVLGGGQFGRLIDPGDTTALAEAISALCDPKLGQPLGQAGRKRVVEEYSMERMLRDYADLYAAVARSAGRGDGNQCGNATSHAKPRVVMLGPVPPPAGGMASVVVNLRDSELSHRCGLTVMNNAKTTREGRALVVGIGAQIRLLGRLVGQILRGRGEIVHVHTCSGFPFWRDCLHAAAARLLGGLAILHVHGARFDDFAGGLGRMARGAMRFAFEHVSAVIVLSEDWLSRLKPYAPRANWRVVPNGVPVPAETAAVESRKPVFLFLGDLGERKGTRDLVKGASIALRRGFDGRVDLAGRETEPGEKDALERLVAEAGCESRVRLVGVLSGEPKAQALLSSACLVLPSYAEGLPMAILEAMACGLPIISTKVGAIPEVIREGVEGFLVEPGDVEGLADCMVRVSRDARLRKRMGEAARLRLREHYSLQVMVERIMEVYRDVLQGAAT